MECTYLVDINACILTLLSLVEDDITQITLLTERIMVMCNTCLWDHFDIGAQDFLPESLSKFLQILPELLLVLPKFLQILSRVQQTLPIF